MCCSAARLFAALVTFTIGTLVAIPFLNQPTEILPTPIIEKGNGYICTSFQVRRSDNVKPESDSRNRVSAENEKKPRFCNDKTIALFWSQLQNSSEDFWSRVNSTFDVYDCAKMFEAEKIDLNKDGIKEIKIRGQYGNFCGATGNCAEWIFKKGNKFGEYKLILQTGGEYFHLKKSSTNGHRDIYITTHDSVSSSYHTVYKFSGKEYKEDKCWFEDYGVDGVKITETCDEKIKIAERELRERESIIKE